MENLLLGVRRPSLVKAFSESSDNILWSITSALSLHALNVFFHFFDIIGETFDRKSVSIAMVSVADKAHSDLQFSLIVINDVVNNLFQSIFGSLDP